MHAIREPGLAPHVPPTMSRLLGRQRVRRRVRGVGAAALLIVAAVAISLLERTASGRATAIVLGLLALPVAAWPFVVPDLASYVVANEHVVWVFRATTLTSGSVSSDRIVLATDTGLEAGISLTGLPDRHGDAIALEQEALQRYPHAHQGFTPALRAAFDHQPSSLLRGATPRRPTVWHRLARHVRWVIGAGILGALLLWMILPLLMSRP